MRTQVRSKQVAAPPSGASDQAAGRPEAAPDQALADLLAALGEAERQVAVAVSLAGELAGSGAAERCHGLPLDLLLAADAGMTGGDRHTLITAGQVLDTMPVLAAAHRGGQVSWGQVRHVVAAVKRRSLDDRAVIDARVADTLADRDRTLDPDRLCEAVDAAVDELISRRAVEQRDDRAAPANRLWAQLGFDGRVAGGFSYDPISAAMLLDALAAAQGRPAADDPDRAPEIPTAQQQSAAASLLEICQQWLGGTPGSTGDAAGHDGQDHTGPGGPDDDGDDDGDDGPGHGRGGGPAGGAPGGGGPGGGAPGGGAPGGGGPGGSGPGGSGPGGRCGCSGGRRARPAYVVDLDADRLDASQPGRLRLRLRGPAPRVSGRRVAADAAAGADVRVVVTAGGAPQAVTGVVRTDAANLPVADGLVDARAPGLPTGQQAGFAALLAAITHAVNRDSQVARVVAGDRPLCDPDQLDAPDIPAATRIAVAARDGGCRFYGCSAPVDWCDVHHLTHRADGGDHHPDRLALFCRPDHRRIHKHGWTLSLDPATGMITGRRGHRQWRTEPRSSLLAPALPHTTGTPPAPQRAPTSPAGPDPPDDPDLPF